MSKDISCPPFAPVLMESTRAIGYSMKAAIADVIDNSIAADADNVWIYFNPIGDPFIAILDDGIGMSSSELTEAMRYGTQSPLKKRKDNDLGRYGLGMKTASLSQCKCLTVVSKQRKKKTVNARQWDLDYITKTGEWSLRVLNNREQENIPEIDKLSNADGGTLVVWQTLDKVKVGSLSLESSMESHMEETAKHLSLVFHRYLSGEDVKKVNIFVNDLKVEPFDPFFVAKSTKVMDEETITIPGYSGKVSVKAYLLPHPSKMTKSELEKYGGKEGLRSLQGFYVYRNKRLVIWGNWFRLVRMDENSKLARVRVDIPNSLDELWTLDIKKSTAYPPEIVKTRLSQLLKPIINSSKRTYGFRQKKEVADSVAHVWDKVETRDGIRYVINQDHPVMKMLYEKIDDEAKDLLKSYIQIVQDNLLWNNMHDDMFAENKIVTEIKSADVRKNENLIHMFFENTRDIQSAEKTRDLLLTTAPFNELEYEEVIQKEFEEACRNVQN